MLRWNSTLYRYQLCRRDGLRGGGFLSLLQKMNYLAFAQLYLLPVLCFLSTHGTWNFMFVLGNLYSHAGPQKYIFLGTAFCYTFVCGLHCDHGDVYWAVLKNTALSKNAKIYRSAKRWVPLSPGSKERALFLNPCRSLTWPFCVSFLPYCGTERQSQMLTAVWKRISGEKLAINARFWWGNQKVGFYEDQRWWGGNVKHR